MEINDRAIEQRLQELDLLETVPVFSRAFHRLIAGLVMMVGEERGVRVALAGMVDVELRYHRELQRTAGRDHVEAEALQEALERYHVGLRAVCHYVAQVQPDSALAAAACDLILAECSYHLGRTPDVVEPLERVVGSGVNEPLIHFALGYNRYLLALETYTLAGSEQGERLVQDPVGFRLQCLWAVVALEDGLCGGGLDGQLYWWIGTVLEAAGLTEAAQDAYDKSAELLHPDCPRGDVCPGEGGTLRQHGSASQAITDEEVGRAGRLLGLPFNPAGLLDAEQD